MSRACDVLAARGMTVRWWLTWVASWAAVSGFAGVAVPIEYPYQAHFDFVPSAVVVGIVAPIAVGAIALGEGPSDLVAGHSRRLGMVRLAAVTGFAAVGIAGSWSLAGLVDLPASLVCEDAVLLTGLATVGVAVGSPRLGWVLPLTCVLVFSAPGLIPWQANVLYRLELQSVRLVVDLAAVTAGVASYGLLGSGAAVRGAELRRSSDEGLVRFTGG